MLLPFLEINYKLGKVQKAGEILKTKTKGLICFHRENRHSLKNTQVKKKLIISTPAIGVV